MTSFFSLQIILLLGLLGLAVTAAVTDLRSYRIPNSISLAIAASFPIFVLAGGADFRGGLFAGGLVFAVGVFLYSRGWMGGGDVKLLAALSLWAGTELVLPMVVIITLTGGIMSFAEWFRIGGFNRLLARHIPTMDGAIAVPAARERAVVPYAAAILAGALYVAVSRAVILFGSLEAF
ncbi:MAG: prepilin peptidase [Alphaproteobacteria bacterium]